MIIIVLFLWSTEEYYNILKHVCRLWETCFQFVMIFQETDGNLLLRQCDIACINGIVCNKFVLTVFANGLIKNSLF